MTSSPNTLEDGWIAWNGGECPVSEDQGVEIKWLDGEELRESKGKAHRFSWNSYEAGNHGTDSDIIAYRVVQS